MTAQHGNDGAQARIRDGVDTVKEQAAHAYDAASEKVKTVAHQAGGAVETNPLGVLAGGLALGAVVGAILPRSAKEKELLAPLGKRIGATATAALAAAKETGRSELSNIGLSKGNAKDQARTFMSNVAKAAGNAGKAALDAGKEQARQNGGNPA